MTIFLLIDPESDGHYGHGVVIQKGEMSGTKHAGEVHVYEGGMYEVDPDKVPGRHGFGRFQWSPKSYYIGGWNFHNRQGDGEHMMMNGDYYKGSWMDDCMDGKGVMTRHNGFVYDGEWSRDKMNGTGTMREPNGTAWTGHFSFECPFQVNGMTWRLANFLLLLGIQY